MKVFLTCAVLLFTLPGSAWAQSLSTTLTFEDVLGPVLDNSLLSAPTPVTISGVTFEGPVGENAFNVGKDVGTNPFTSDYFGFWTFGPGGTMTCRRANRLPQL